MKNKRKKILFYTMSMQKGGAERVISNLSNYLIDKFDIVIVCNINDTSYYKLNNNIKYIILDKFKINNAFKKLYSKISNIRTKQLKKIVLQENPNVIISFLPEPSFRILSLRKKINSPIIISDRNDPKMEYRNFIINILMKKLYKKADGFIFQTNDAKNYFRNIINCNNMVIPNPVDNNFITEYYNGARKKTIVTAGRLTKQKNHKLLIDAFKNVNHLHPEYKLLIYGDGELREELRKYITINNLDDKVTLCGVTNNLKNDIYDAGMFVLSSDYEGMPNVLMEAMCMGLPCISTDCSGGGARFLIKNGVNGVLVPVNDINAMSDAINEVIDNINFAGNISRQANIMSKKFSTDIICKKWEKFINSYLKE